MSKTNSIPETATPHNAAVEALREHRDLHAGARRTLEYLNGNRTRADLDLEADVLPALVMCGGKLALRYHHTDKTEFVYATNGEPEAVASCYHDDSDALVNNIGFPVDELREHRGIPDPDGFVHVGYQVAHEAPRDAHPNGGD